MIIDRPAPTHIRQLWSLWREAFGDSGEFLDAFFTKAFSPDRCRCAFDSGKVIAAVYWFDCELRGKRIAYLYALATAIEHRGRGVARKLTYDGSVGSELTVNATSTYPERVLTTVECDDGGTQLFAQDVVIFTSENIDSYVAQEQAGNDYDYLNLK